MPGAPSWHSGSLPTIGRRSQGLWWDDPTTLMLPGATGEMALLLAENSLAELPQLVEALRVRPQETQQLLGKLLGSEGTVKELVQVNAGNLCKCPSKP